MVQVSDLTFGYKANRPVLEDIHLTFQQGGIYGILGENGVGKTTFLHLLGGLVFPKKGQIKFQDHDCRTRSARYLQSLFYVPAEGTLPKGTVATFAKLNAPFYPNFDQKIWENALATLRVDASLQSVALSFGQKKKALLAFALASGCPLLLLDEPTDGLDIPSKDAFRKLLASTTEDDKTVLIATHHVQDIETLIDHLVVLQEMGILLSKSLDDLNKKVHTQQLQSLPNNRPVLYRERTAQGYHCLLQTNQDDSAPLDIELLFKGLLQAPEQILQAINRK